MLPRVAVFGANGYTGEQLVRLLLRHPGVTLAAITSRAEAGKPLTSVMPRFRGWPGGAYALHFTAPDVAAMVAAQIDVAVLALPHGVAAEYARPLLEAGIRVIDLSADFRIHDAAVYADFYEHAHPAPDLLREAVYGLPELYRAEIKAARLIASPGCYPTSIILPLVPLLRAGLIDSGSIATFSMSGASGAGRKASTDLLFCEINESLRAYGVPKHRHLSEIEQELSLAAGRPVVISFTPHLVPVTAGIATTTYADLALGATAEQITAVLTEAYASEPFVRLLPAGQLPDTKFVTGTNFVDIAFRIDPRTNRVVLLSAEDNTIKGAGGQAIQSLNLLLGRPETEGLL